MRCFEGLSMMTAVVFRVSSWASYIWPLPPCPAWGMSKDLGVMQSSPCQGALKNWAIFLFHVIFFIHIAISSIFLKIPLKTKWTKKSFLINQFGVARCFGTRPTRFYQHNTDFISVGRSSMSMTVRKVLFQVGYYAVLITAMFMFANPSIFS